MHSENIEGNVWTEEDLAETIGDHMKSMFQQDSESLPLRAAQRRIGVITLRSEPRPANISRCRCCGAALGVKSAAIGDGDGARTLRSQFAGIGARSC